MRQFLNSGDLRNQGFCIHCGGQDETRDHSPSRVFLDEPFPENLPLAPACRACNNGFSLDEEYLASLLECVTSGDVMPDAFERQKIANIVRRSPGLAARLRAARRTEDGQVIWSFDEARVSRVILKLARGHAAFELNEPQCSEPSSIGFAPLITMSDAQVDAFFNELPGGSVYPEVGSRALERLFTGEDTAGDGRWVIVQPGRYRYAAGWGGGVSIRMVIRDYLACEVVWD